jgi:hypothetical protein
VTVESVESNGSYTVKKGRENRLTFFIQCSDSKAAIKPIAFLRRNLRRFLQPSDRNYWSAKTAFVDPTVVPFFVPTFLSAAKVNREKCRTDRLSFLLREARICVVQNTEYTQSGNVCFLAEYSIMLEKLGQPGEGGGASPPSFTIFTITYKVKVHAPAERALPEFHLYSICTLWYRSYQREERGTIWVSTEANFVVADREI